MNDPEAFLSRDEAAHLSKFGIIILAILYSLVAGCAVSVRLWPRLKFWLTVTRVCKWCGVVKHRAPFGSRDNVTHGICRACFNKETARLKTFPHANHN